jgi:methionyl-tRNA formyltransferase
MPWRALKRGELPVTSTAWMQGVSYAAKISKAETRVDFTRNPALDVHNHVRGLAPVARRLVRAAKQADRSRAGETACIRGGDRTLALEQAAPGTVVLDDQLTIACGEGASAVSHGLQKAGGNPLCGAGTFCVEHRLLAGHGYQLMPRYQPRH